MTAPIGILVMAYGTASGPDDIERYYTDIRGGLPPSPEHLAELRARYAAIDDRFPLLEITRRQAAGLEQELNADSPSAFHCYLGMKHSPPFIREGVERMHTDGIERGIALVMAPHWSSMSVETYVERVELALKEIVGGPSFTYVRHWHDHPLFIELLASRVGDALATLTREERDRAAVIFSAHSLPVRTEPDGSHRCLHCGDCPGSCRYRDQLRETANLVGMRLGLPSCTVAWQSAGRTSDPWWGPDVENAIRELAKEGHPAVCVCSAGFVADHLETLYDLDIEAQQVAHEVGVRLVRTEMPNAEPGFVQVLAAVVREHLAALSVT